MDIFDTKGIKPMLIAEQAEAFDNLDWLYELKLDGIRCVAYLDPAGKTDLRNKRDKMLLPHLPELSDIHLQVSQKCILDGEVFVLKNGITDFYEIQRRALLTDPFKIRLSAGKYPAAYVAFDILYYQDHLVTDLPLIERKKLLQEIVWENPQISVSRYIDSAGIDLYTLAAERGLEGIVAKRRDSRYYFDKRTKDWIKCKIMTTDDCVICGYIHKANHMTSLVLGQYNGPDLVYRGHVTLGVSLRVLYEHHPKQICASPFGYIPPGNEEAVWLAPDLVCIVEYMPSDKSSFRQPVYRGIRNDKTAMECTVRPQE